MVALFAAAVRHAVLPSVVVVTGLWINRNWVLGQLAARAADKGVLVKPPRVEATVDLSRKLVSTTLTDLGLQNSEGTEAIDVGRVDVVRASYDPSGGLDLVIDGLHVLFLAYDAKFKDTNITRVLDKLGGGGDADGPRPAKKSKGPRAKFKGRVLRGVIEVKAVGPLGTRSLVTPGATQVRDVFQWFE